MQCDHARARLSAYLDGELDAGAAKHLTSHLRQCLDCQEALRDLQGFDDELRSLPRVDLGPDFFNRLITGLSERESFERATFAEELLANAKHSSLADILWNFFGAGHRSGNDTLDEFSDFPPLSIGSAYFTVFGQPEH